MATVVGNNYSLQSILDAVIIVSWGSLSPIEQLIIYNLAWGEKPVKVNEWIIQHRSCRTWKALIKTGVSDFENQKQIQETNKTYPHTH